MTENGSDDESDGERELCGEPTTKGHPCKNLAESCPWNHGGENNNGRPSKFSDERARKAIAAASEEGKSQAGCARAAGVDENCIGRWKDSNPTFEDESGDERDFRDAFAAARAEGESLYIRDGRSFDGDTSFAKFMLASSFGYKKTERQEHEHSGHGGGPIEVSIGGDQD